MLSATRDTAHFLVTSLSTRIRASVLFCALTTVDMIYLNIEIFPIFPISCQYGNKSNTLDLCNFMIYQDRVVFSPRSYKLGMTLVYFDTKKLN